MSDYTPQKIIEAEREHWDRLEGRQKLPEPPGALRWARLKVSGTEGQEEPHPREKYGGPR